MTDDADDLVTMLSLTPEQCLIFGGGYYPPRRADYEIEDEFYEEAVGYWHAFHAAMRASGYDDASTLLAGCLPPEWEVAEAERCASYTASNGG